MLVIVEEQRLNKNNNRNLDKLFIKKKLDKNDIL